jgi:hypothetical protein
MVEMAKQKRKKNKCRIHRGAAVVWISDPPHWGCSGCNRHNTANLPVELRNLSSQEYERRTYEDEERVEEMSSGGTS